MTMPLVPNNPRNPPPARSHQDAFFNSAINKITELFQKHSTAFTSSTDGKSFTASLLSGNAPKLLEELSHLVTTNEEVQGFFKHYNFSLTSDNNVLCSQTTKEAPVETIISQALHACQAHGLTMPSGKQFSYEEFINHPLFSHTQEKSEVYFKLLQLVQSPSFQQDYEALLQNLHKETWFEPYRQTPETLALLSLIAFLDKTISKWDLFTIHAVADAFHEEQKGVITNVHITLLNQDNAASFLESHHIPPFWTPSASVIRPLIISDKSLEALGIIKRIFCYNLGSKSPLERSVITYTFTSSHPEDPQSMEWMFLLHSFVTEGFTDINSPAITTSLLPLQMQAELHKSQISRSTPPLEEHTFIFGYTEDTMSDSIFAQGYRVFSIASPLFNVPYVHGAIEGPKGLAIELHDVRYHYALDINNPHLQEILDVYHKVQSCIPTLKPEEKPVTKLFARKLLDRESNDYRFIKSPQDAFIQFIMNAMFPYEQWKVSQSLWYHTCIKHLLPKIMENCTLWDQKKFEDIVQISGRLLSENIAKNPFYINQALTIVFQLSSPQNHLDEIKWLVSFLPQEQQQKALQSVMQGFIDTHLASACLELANTWNFTDKWQFLTMQCLQQLENNFDPEQSVKEILQQMIKLLHTDRSLPQEEQNRLCQAFLIAFQQSCSFDCTKELQQLQISY